MRLMRRDDIRYQYEHSILPYDDPVSVWEGEQLSAGHRVSVMVRVSLLAKLSVIPLTSRTHHPDRLSYETVTQRWQDRFQYLWVWLLVWSKMSVCHAYLYPYYTSISASVKFLVLLLCFRFDTSLQSILWTIHEKICVVSSTSHCQDCDDSWDGCSCLDCPTDWSAHLLQSSLLYSHSSRYCHHCR